MTPAEYHDCTFEEIVFAVRAHRAKEVEYWRQTREICYCLYQANRDEKKRLLTKFEFMPLEGDPTEQEIKKMEEDAYNNELKRIEGIKQYYRERGLLN